MKSAQIDIPVLLIFMVRPEQFSLVFEQVKIARPSKLFLYQDGPRVEKPDDIENIKKCRIIAEDIDWDCEVHKFYQEKNVGCDPSEYLAIKWFFEHVNHGIILEDDDIPSQSFFPFCKELLERYADDTRIARICGMNHLDIYDKTSDSYIFTTSGAIWGWATWKRTVDLWDVNMDFMDDARTRSLLKKNMGKGFFNQKLKSWELHKQENHKMYYESLGSASRFLNSQLSIVPVKNLITNIGIAGESTHSTNSIKKVPKNIRRVFFMKRHELDFPLKHPKYIINDEYYAEEVLKIFGIGNILFRFTTKIKSFIYRILGM
jgi:hypothetical protein